MQHDRCSSSRLLYTRMLSTTIEITSRRLKHSCVPSLFITKQLMMLMHSSSMVSSPV